MATANFSYADYLLFAGASDINPVLFSTVAAGVIGHLKGTYLIYPEIETLTTNIFISSPTFYLPAAPVNTITSITYGGSVMSNSKYTWYGQDVVLTTPITDYRKPVTLVLEVGYTEIPEDLKLAIYRHISAVIFDISKDTDNIDKTANSSGNTTYYRQSAIPEASKNTYDFYSPRILISY